MNRRREEAGVRTRHILQYVAGGSKQHSSSSGVRMIKKWRNEWELVRFSADVDVSPWLKTITHPAVNTYNIKEALTGIYGVQQLVNVVLSRRGIRLETYRPARQHSDIQIVLTFYSDFLRCFEFHQFLKPDNHPTFAYFYNIMTVLFSI